MCEVKLPFFSSQTLKFDTILLHVPLLFIFIFFLKKQLDSFLMSNWDFPTVTLPISFSLARPLFILC